MPQQMVMVREQYQTAFQACGAGRAKKQVCIRDGYLQVRLALQDEDRAPDSTQQVQGIANVEASVPAPKVPEQHQPSRDPAGSPTR